MPTRGENISLHNVLSGVFHGYLFDIFLTFLGIPVCVPIVHENRISPIFHSPMCCKQTTLLILSYSPRRYVFWYHNERMINYDSERGISVTTTPGRRTHSQLFIQRAEVSDSGNYTCAPSSSLPASISVFVSGKLTSTKLCSTYNLCLASARETML